MVRACITGGSMAAQAKLVFTMTFGASCSSADPDDIESDLEGCAAVLLDSASAKDLIRSLMTALELARCAPELVLCTSKVAASEKRCALAQKLVNLCRPAVISGRIPDLVALSKAITGAGRGACTR